MDRVRVLSVRKPQEVILQQAAFLAMGPSNWVMDVVVAVLVKRDTFSSGWSEIITPGRNGTRQLRAKALELLGEVQHPLDRRVSLYSESSSWDLVHRFFEAHPGRPGDQLGQLVDLRKRNPQHGGPTSLHAALAASVRT